MRNSRHHLWTSSQSTPQTQTERVSSSNQPIPGSNSSHNSPPTPPPNSHGSHGSHGPPHGFLRSQEYMNDAATVIYVILVFLVMIYRSCD